MDETRRWPAALWIARHGESSGNVARDRAEQQGAARLELTERDMDVPLSELGERQAGALGEWIAEMAEDDRPSAVLCSPYVRARQTAELLLDAAGLAGLPLVVDERLREREFGALDGLTSKGIAAQFPEEAERRRVLGKFYHRPPGGESWADVLQRLRTLLHEVRRDYDGQRVLIVAHQVVVLLIRYLLEHMDEQSILAVDAAGDIANCSLTQYSYDENEGSLVRVSWNETAPVEAEGEQVTAEPEVASGAH